MKSEQELLKYFESDELRPFSDDDLFGEWQAASLPSVASQPATSDLTNITKIPEIVAMLEDMDNYLRKFRFGFVSLEKWKERYSFPRKATIRAFTKHPENRASEESSIVNTSEASIARWVREEVIPGVLDAKDEIRIVIGGVGAGKSTFNKYVTSVHFEDFQSNSIVSSRIEYRKLYDHAVGKLFPHPNLSPEDKQKLQAIVQRYAYCCILRDLFHFGWSTPRKSPMPAASAEQPHRRAKDGPTFEPTETCFWPSLDFTNAPSTKAFEATISDKRISQIDVAETILDVQTAIKSFRKSTEKGRGSRDKNSDQKRRSRWFLDLVEDQRLQKSLEPFARYAADLGIRFHVIFDGLDYVQVADFIAFTSHRGMLTAIARWLVQKGNRLPLPHIQSSVSPAYQVTMRQNTYELFWIGHSQAMSDMSMPLSFVAAPEFKDVFSSIEKSQLWQDANGDSAVSGIELQEIFTGLQAQLGKALGLQKRQFRDLFMNNTRYRVHFTRNVFEELLKETLAALDKQGTPHTQTAIIEQLRIEVASLKDHKEYRLIDLLLHSKNQRFANFVRLDGQIDLDKHKKDPKYLEDTLHDNNIRSGYVGNVFNYHIPYDSREDIQFFLEKIRILNVLIKHKRRKFSKLSFTKEQLCQEFQNRGWTPSKYFDFSIGIMVRENLIAGYSIEAGAEGYVVTELGEIIRRKFVTSMTYLENVFFGCFLPRGIVRRSLNIYRATAQRHEWVAASIFHCWLLLRMIRTAEGEVERSLFEEVRSQLKSTVDRIINAATADSRITRRALRHIESFNEDIERG